MSNLVSRYFFTNPGLYFSQTAEPGNTLPDPMPLILLNKTLEHPLPFQWLPFPRNMPTKDYPLYFRCLGFLLNIQDEHRRRKVLGGGGGGVGVRGHVLLVNFLGFWVIQTGYWPNPFSSDKTLQIGGLFHLSSSAWKGFFTLKISSTDLHKTVETGVDVVSVNISFKRLHLINFDF